MMRMRASASSQHGWVPAEMPKKLWINSDTVAASDNGHACSGNGLASGYGQPQCKLQVLRSTRRHVLSEVH